MQDLNSTIAQTHTWALGVKSAGFVQTTKPANDGTGKPAIAVLPFCRLALIEGRRSGGFPGVSACTSAGLLKSANLQTSTCSTAGLPNSPKAQAGSRSFADLAA
ncbi:MAG TPA: hypothetical protein PKY73_15775 [Hyphomonas sp.]|jgi:hypothetical protein|nr:hypothetical protein [Hyphomonas sp.]